MSLQETLMYISDQYLFIPFMIVLASSIILSIQTRFVQIRALPKMFKILFARQKVSKDAHLIQARSALFTAMATTIGIGNIVGPIVAIGWGGPGALVGFMIASLFGGATTFSEVVFSLHYRKRFEDGTVSGGPMQYLKDSLGKFAAYFYALSFFTLYIVWTGNQSNQIAALLEPWHVSRWWVGVAIAFSTIIILMGGARRVGDFAAKLVPAMFLLYSTAGIWVLLCNSDKLAGVFKLIFTSFFTPQAAVGAVAGYSFQSAMRWGLGKALHSNEAGMGSAGIAHSVADVKNPVDQGILSIVSVYTNGFLCVLSGLLVLVTGVWQDANIPHDISMMYKVFSMYFPGIGEIILLVSGVLFAFTTAVGNSFFGTQCYLFVTKNRWVHLYYFAIALLIVWGAISNAKAVWSISDLFMVPVAMVHILGLVILSFKRSDLLKADIHD